MNLQVTAVLLSIALFPAVLSAEEKPVMVVFDLKVKGFKIPAEDYRKLNLRLQAKVAEGEAAEGGRYRLIRRLVDGDSTPAGTREVKDASGRSLAPRLLTTVEVTKLARECLTTLSVWDGKHATVVRAASAQRSPCTESDIEGMLDEVVAKFSAPRQPYVEPPEVKAAKAAFLGRWDFLHAGNEEIERCDFGKIHHGQLTSLERREYSKFNVEFTLDGEGDLQARLEIAFVQTRSGSQSKTTTESYDWSFPGGEQVKDAAGVHTRQDQLRADLLHGLKVVEVSLVSDRKERMPPGAGAPRAFHFVLSEDGQKLGLFSRQEQYYKYKYEKLSVGEWIERHLVERQDSFSHPVGQCTVKWITYATKQEPSEQK